VSVTYDPRPSRRIADFQVVPKHTVAISAIDQPLTLRGVVGMPAKPGVAFAGTVAPVAAIPISATATAVLVVAPRTPESIGQLIRPSLSADPKGPH
jgi:hypothetical protein